MKTITFSYTKSDGSVSERTLLAMVAPGGDKYAGIDVSSIDPVEAQKFIDEAKLAHEAYLLTLKELQIKYDLKHNYRQFNTGGMTDITEI